MKMRAREHRHVWISTSSTTLHDEVGENIFHNLFVFYALQEQKNIIDITYK